MNKWNPGTTGLTRHRLVTATKCHQNERSTWWVVFFTFSLVRGRCACLKTQVYRKVPFSALSGRGGSRDHSLVLSVCLHPSLYIGDGKNRSPGTRLRTLSRKLIQIRKWGFWKLGNGLFPKWPLPADEVRHLSQSTLNAPLLNEQKPVKHVVAFKAIPTSGHITQWFRCGPSRWITRKGHPGQYLVTQYQTSILRR